MSAQIIPVEPFDLVVFGGTGDLARRKLLPALYHRDRRRPDPGGEPDHRRVARRAQTATPIRRGRGGACASTSARRGAIAPAGLERFLGRLDYVPLDATGEAAGSDLAALLPADAEDRVRVFYLRYAPGPVRADLPASSPRRGLVTPQTRVVLEKPIGRDLASAQRDQRRGRRGLRRSADLPHRPLPRQGDGAEPDGAALRQRPLRAAVEPPHIDHVQITVAETRRRRRPRAATTTARARCATWCRTTCCSCSAWSRWSRRPRSTPTRCATRR